MSKTCSTCEQLIKRSKNFIECGSYCGRYFHKECVQISEVEYTSLSKSNIFFKCNLCADLNFSSLSKSLNALTNSVAELKNDLSELKMLFGNNSPPRKTAKINSKSAVRVIDAPSSNCVAAAIKDPITIAPPSLSNQHTEPSTLSSHFQIQSSSKNCPATPSLENNNSTSHLGKSSEADPDWKSVQKKSKNKMQPKKIIGTDSSSSLTAIPEYKWVHLSRFKTDTTAEDIVKHISQKTNIPSNQFKCFMLIKRGADISTLKFVTFKLSVPAHKLSDVMNSSAWGSFVQIKMFVSQERLQNPQTKNSLTIRPPDITHSPAPLSQQGKIQEQYSPLPSSAPPQIQQKQTTPPPVQALQQQTSNSPPSIPSMSN